MKGYRLFCFGFGYTAKYLVERLEASGDDWSFTGTSRSANKPLPEELDKIYLHQFDGTKPMDEIGCDALSVSTSVLISIPPFKEGVSDLVIHHHLKELASSERIRWVGYISSTGVYGDHGGGWVNEDTTPHPLTEQAMARVRAEEEWLNLFHRHNLPVHVFRASGIYGSGRSPLARIIRGESTIIDKPGHYFNRIHVEDMAGIIAQSIANPKPGTVYNMSDDEPASQVDVMKYAYDLLGMDMPVPQNFEAAEMSEMLRDFFKANKRIQNERIKNDLGYALKYPTYREGLTAINQARNQGV